MASIVALLSKDFIKLIAIAVIIASPVAWFVMHKWLQSFAYRTNISWTVFVITTLVALTEFRLLAMTDTNKTESTITTVRSLMRSRSNRS